MKALSLFDGMSCGQIALSKLDIKGFDYFASEIKPAALAVTKANYPNTKFLGDVTQVDFKQLGKVDLLIGGSPCQDFSRANAERLGLAGKKSNLFYYYLDALYTCKPTYFLLENVIMEKFYYHELSKELGIYPIRINSSRVSAQMRDRLYWTNIGPYDENLFGVRSCALPQPKDLGITLSSIVTSGYVDRLKARCLLESESRPLADQERMWHRYNSTGFTTIVYNDKDLDYTKGIRYLNQIELERLQTVPEGYTSMLPRNKAASLLGDGWTVDVIKHILSFLPS